MTLLELLQPFLGQPSRRMRFLEAKGLNLTVGLGFTAKKLTFEDRGRHGRARHGTFQKWYVGLNQGLSFGDIDDAQVIPEALLGQNGKIFCRPYLGRDLHEDDFVGLARIMSFTNLHVLCFGNIGTAVSLAMTAAPPAAIASAVWGSIAVGFHVETDSDLGTSFSAGFVDNSLSRVYDTITRARGAQGVGIRRW